MGTMPDGCLADAFADRQTEIDIRGMGSEEAVIIADYFRDYGFTYNGRDLMAKHLMYLKKFGILVPGVGETSKTIGANYPERHGGGMRISTAEAIVRISSEKDKDLFMIDGFEDVFG